MIVKSIKSSTEISHHHFCSPHTSWKYKYYLNQQIQQQILGSMVNQHDALYPEQFLRFFTSVKCWINLLERSLGQEITKSAELVLNLLFWVRFVFCLFFSFSHAAMFSQGGTCICLSFSYFSLSENFAFVDFDRNFLPSSFYIFLSEFFLTPWHFSSLSLIALAITWLASLSSCCFGTLTYFPLSGQVLSV